MEKTKQIIEHSGVPARQLKFEITESCLVKDIEHVNALLMELQEIGIRIELDDFGTGYSSLNTLYNLPIHALKIDRSLVSNIEGENPTRAIISASIAMAKAMSMEVIAEGVETRAQSVFLGQAGVTVQQGYYFSRPLPFDAFATFLEERKEKPFQMVTS